MTEKKPCMIQYWEVLRPRVYNSVLCQKKKFK